MASPSPLASVATSPHLDPESLDALFYFDRPLMAASASKALLRLWGEPNFERVSVQVDGEEKDVFLARAFQDPPVVVREEHLEFWSAIVEEHRNFHGAIWGQPGAGKSVSLDVFTSICLEQKIPFARYKLGEPWASLFVEIDGRTREGPEPRLFTIPMDALANLVFTIPNIVFLDAVEASAPFPLRVSDPHTLRLSKVVLAARADRARYHHWAKNRGSLEDVIKLLSREEVQAIDQIRRSTVGGEPTSFASVRATIPSGIPVGEYPMDVVKRDMADPKSDDGAFWSVLVAYHVLGPSPRDIFDPEQRRRRSDNFADDLLPPLRQINFFRTQRTTQEFLDGKVSGFRRFFFQTPETSLPPWKRRFQSYRQTATIIPTSHLHSLLVEQVEHAIMVNSLDIHSLCSSGVPFDTARRIGLAYLVSRRETVELHLLRRRSPITLTIAPSHNPPSWDPRATGESAPAEPGLYRLPFDLVSLDAFLVGSSPSSSGLASVFPGLFPSEHFDIVLQVAPCRYDYHGPKRVELDLVLEGIRRRSRAPKKARTIFVFVSMVENMAKSMEKVTGFDEVGWIVVNRNASRC
ncbi:hypothetical protein JCM6882_002607 [Rhodosporidiobolus microsporus]